MYVIFILNIQKAQVKTVKCFKLHDFTQIFIKNTSDMSHTYFGFKVQY